MADRHPAPPPRGPGACGRPRAVGLQAVRAPAGAGSPKASPKAIGASPTHQGSPTQRTPWQRSLSPSPLPAATTGLRPPQHHPKLEPDVATAPTSVPTAANAASDSPRAAQSASAAEPAGASPAASAALPPTPPVIGNPPAADAAQKLHEESEEFARGEQEGEGILNAPYSAVATSSIHPGASEVAQGFWANVAPGTPPVPVPPVQGISADASEASRAARPVAPPLPVVAEAAAEFPQGF